MSSLSLPLFHPRWLRPTGRRPGVGGRITLPPPPRASHSGLTHLGVRGACCLSSLPIGIPEVRAPPHMDQQDPSQPVPGLDVVPEDVTSEAVNALLYSGESPPSQLLNLSTTP